MSCPFGPKELLPPKLLGVLLQLFRNLLTKVADAGARHHRCLHLFARGQGYLAPRLDLKFREWNGKSKAKVGKSKFLPRAKWHWSFTVSHRPEMSCSHVTSGEVKAFDPKQRASQLNQTKDDEIGQSKICKSLNRQQALLGPRPLERN